MKVRTLMGAITIAIATALGASGAMANNVNNSITDTRALIPFGALHTDYQLFTDTFTFHGLARAEVAVVIFSPSLSFPFDFSSAKLNGVALDTTHVFGDAIVVRTPTRIVFDGVGDLVLVVEGRNFSDPRGMRETAFYTGELNVKLLPPVPEPASWTLALLGLLGLALIGWRARRSTVA